jgi:hypothetical protein
MADSIDDDYGEWQQIICEMDLYSTVQEVQGKAGHASFHCGKGR